MLDPSATARPEDVVGWVTLAVERRRTTSRRPQRALAGRPRHPRRELLDGLLADVAIGVRSPLELTYLRDVERAHGLHALVSRQLPSRTHKAVRDVCYTDFGSWSSSTDGSVTPSSDGFATALSSSRPPTPGSSGLPPALVGNALSRCRDLVGLLAQSSRPDRGFGCPTLGG